jgi:hypothetical protein
MFDRQYITGNTGKNPRPTYLYVLNWADNILPKRKRSASRRKVFHGKVPQKIKFNKVANPSVPFSTADPDSSEI